MVLIYEYRYVLSEMMIVFPTLYHPTHSKGTIDTDCLDTMHDSKLNL